MAIVTRARAAGILAVSLLMLGAPAAQAGISEYQPDASIRRGSGSYVGEGITSWSGSSVSNAGVVGDKLTFWIKIRNASPYPDSFEIKPSSGFTNGYRVRYYTATGYDVTSLVTSGEFTTPLLFYNEKFVLRATVTVRSLAKEGSFTSRLITVISLSDPDSARDAVRFTGKLAWLSFNYLGHNGVNAFFTVTGGGLKRAATVTSFFTETIGGNTGTSTLGSVPSTGDVSIGPMFAPCYIFQSATVMTRAANGSAVRDKETFSC